jgi:hypothetical protein
MKTIAIALLLGGGALSMTVPASAAGADSKGTTLASTAFTQVDMSSRHRRYRASHYYVSRTAVTPRSFRPAPPLTPLVTPPYFITYRTYGRSWGPPATYVATGPDLYAYGPYPYSDPYGYGRVRSAPGALYDTGGLIGGGVVGFGVPGTTW